MVGRFDGSRGARLVPAVLALAGVLSIPSVAAAQDTTLYLDRLRIGGAPDDGIGVWRPHFGEKTRLYGQIGLGWSLNPYRVESYIDTIDQGAIVEEQNGAPVTMQLITYVSAGAEILDRFSFQVSFPLVLFQDGNSMVNTSALIREEVDRQAVAPMDLRLDGRVVFFRNEEKTLKLGAIATFFAPVGNEYSWGGDTTVHGSLGIAAEYDARLFAVALNAGYHFRPPASLNDFRVADELTYGVGAYVPLGDGRFRVAAEVTGSSGMTEGLGDVDNNPLEWRVEGRMGLGSEPSQGWVGLSAGSRLTAGYAPDFRTVAVVGGWFNLFDTKPKQRDFVYVIPGDADKDKLPDDIDMCPNAAEDGKGVHTDDGCPEQLNDADSDGVYDAEDACPHEPGPRNADPAKNGCPEFIRRGKNSDLIEVLKEVQFAFDRADLLPPAFPILNEVVRLLIVNPDIELVRIEGHTDDFGSHKYNDELSQSRADSVMEYLVKRGIVANRLEAKGFGKRRPIVDNSTAEGRQKNRRVEFHIVKSKGAPPVQGSNPTGTTPGTTPTPAPSPSPGGSATPPPAPSPSPGGPATPPPAPTPAGTFNPLAPPAPPPKPATTAAPTAAPAAPPAKPPTTAAPAAPTAAPTAAPAAPPAKPTNTAAPAAPPPKPSGTTAPATPPK
jgi:OOP family OmpA-OmpF porin